MPEKYIVSFEFGERIDTLEFDSAQTTLEGAIGLRRVFGAFMLPTKDGSANPSKYEQAARTLRIEKRKVE